MTSPAETERAVKSMQSYPADTSTVPALSEAAISAACAGTKDKFAWQIRKIIIEQSKRAGVGHIGSALSVADIIACLYNNVMNVSAPQEAHQGDNQRDRFVLSKGHAALGLYAAFYLRGWISEETLNTFCGDGSRLGVHPEHALKGVDFATGSLGQGLSFGVGAALAAKRQGSARRSFVLLSVAECNEGSVWEAIMFASHHKLSNLIAIIDLNGQQAFGYTEDVINLSPMAEKWRAFGFDVHEVDGHDVGAMTRTIESLNTVSGAPHVLIARTTFGKGVSFMERQIKWHYSPLSQSEFETAMAELEEGK
ncbi:MAG TPA: transketolase [Chroococcales cyanobacterium]